MIEHSERESSSMERRGKVFGGEKREREMKRERVKKQMRDTHHSSSFPVEG